MTAIGFKIWPGQEIPADVTWVLDDVGDPHQRDDAGLWHQGGIGADPNPWPDEDPLRWGPLTVTAVREQPAEPGCPKCRTILNAEAASCDDPWHYDNRPDDLVPDVLDLVRQYGDARLTQGFEAGNGRAPQQHEAKRRGNDLRAQIEAEVQRLRDECTEKINEAQAICTTYLNERDAARGELRRVQADREAHEEALEWSNGQLMQALGVDQLPEVIPAIERLKAARPDPLVLSLPQVPEGAVALVTRNQDGDEVRFVPAPKHPGSWVMASGSPTGDWLLVEILRAFDGSVTVVMREPRTWPKLDGAPEDLETFGGASGRRYAYCVTGTNGVRYYKPVDAAGSAARPVWYWQGVDGPLVEVFDDEDGTR